MVFQKQFNFPISGWNPKKFEARHQMLFEIQFFVVVVVIVVAVIVNTWQRKYNNIGFGLFLSFSFFPV